MSLVAPFYVDTVYICVLYTHIVLFHALLKLFRRPDEVTGPRTPFRPTRGTIRSLSESLKLKILNNLFFFPDVPEMTYYNVE